MLTATQINFKASGVSGCVALCGGLEVNTMKIKHHLPNTNKSLKRHLEELLQCPVALVYESEENIMLVYPQSYEVPVSVVKVGSYYESQPWKSQVLTLSLGVHNPVFDDVPEVVSARRIAQDHIALAIS